mmetsp:Transcript_2733/g.4249  ORF Transcript_2733/g.4249 Transcript_2733/m.4249 type:complete len:91 (+) Transcript_2733:170-442(+)
MPRKGSCAYVLLVDFSKQVLFWPTDKGCSVSNAQASHFKTMQHIQQQPLCTSDRQSSSKVRLASSALILFPVCSLHLFYCRTIDTTFEHP